MLLIYLWVGYPVEHDQPSRVTPFKKSFSPTISSQSLPAYWWGFLSPFSLHAGMFIGLTLPRTSQLLWFLKSNGFCPLSCPEDTVSFWSTLISHFYDLFPLTQWSLSLEGRVWSGCTLCWVLLQTLILWFSEYFILESNSIMKETIQKKKLAKSEIRILHIDEYGKVWHMRILQEQLSLNLTLLHLNESPSLIFCSFFKRTSFTVVLSQRFCGEKPVCSSLNNVSI